MEDQAVHVVGDVGEHQFRLGAGKSDGADEETEADLLVREHMLDGSPKLARETVSLSPAILGVLERRPDEMHHWDNNSNFAACIDEGLSNSRYRRSMDSPWQSKRQRSQVTRHRVSGDVWLRNVSTLEEARHRRNKQRAPKRNSAFWPLLMLACAVVFAAPIVVDRFSLLDRLQAFEWPTTLEAGETIARLPVVIHLSDATAGVRSTTAAMIPQYRGPIPACSGGNRAARRVTCIVDGDTGWQDGNKWRIANIDTPEISSPECANEKHRGYAARDRLRVLMSRGYSLTRHGKGYYGRTLVTVTLADGRDAGDVLIAEGLSQRWPNSGNPWCR